MSRGGRTASIIIIIIITDSQWRARPWVDRPSERLAQAVGRACQLQTPLVGDRPAVRLWPRCQGPDEVRIRG